MTKLTKRKIEELRSRAAKREHQPFVRMDEVLLIYRRKSRVVVVPATVVGIVYDLHIARPISDPRILAYTVRSSAGGELTVLPEDLRPGNILEHIKLSLERDDELGALEERDRCARVEDLRGPTSAASLAAPATAPHQPLLRNSPL